MKNNFDETISGNEKIHGWLTFFLVAIGLGGILAPILGFAHMSMSDYDIGVGLLWSQIGVVCDGILLVGYTVLSVYTIISFCKYRPNAVGLGKSYLIIAFATNLLSLIVGDYEPTGFNSFAQIISRLIWQIIFFLYLSYSVQVESLFPKEERKLFKRDKLIIFSIVTPVIVWLILTFSGAFIHGIAEEMQQNNYTISEDSLSVNEYTDSRIIFECPNELSIEKYENEDDIFYVLYQDDISMTIYSTFDDEDTIDYFEECMQSWADESFNDFEYDVTDERYEVLFGNSFYLKTLQYYSEPVFEWSFVLLFNSETGKCCVVSYYSTTDTDYLQEVIHSIRFKN